MRIRPRLLPLLLCLVAQVCDAQNLLPDPSVEAIKPKDQFGNPFARWSGWVFEGACEFRNGKVAHFGQRSAELVGAQGGKLRVYTPTVSLEPGRYRFTCWLRGLDIVGGQWGVCQDVNFGDETYHVLKKSGTFGWTRIELVRQIRAKRDVQVRIGLWGPGRMWVDDAELTRVPDSTPLTPAPVTGREEAPIVPPGPLDSSTAVRCTDCGYRNMAAWSRCYACGESLASGRVAAQDGPASRPLVTFAEGSVKPFDSGDNVKLVRDHAGKDGWALRLDKSYAVWNGPQSWSGFDFIKANVFNASDEPSQLYFEVHDNATTDYWTRVNYTTVLPPGESMLIIATDLYVGEKSRPGRPLDKAGVKRMVLSIGEAKAPVFFSDLRLERDLSDGVKVPGLLAFSFGPGTTPTLRGFLPVTPATLYSPGRGYGLKNARVWRAYDALQPDPLYQQAICIESGGFAADLPDGRYHVFVNLDSPSGFWGEYQTYRQRIVKANGIEVVHDRMDLDSFRKKYFRFANVEDRPEENTFDKYQRAYFQEKEFDVDVKGGQLSLEFLGENWANAVSALVIYPSAESILGRKYLDNLRERRRFYFDNYFKRVQPNGGRDARGAIPPFEPTAAEQARGLVLWSRDWMQDVPVNAVPRREEVTRKVSIFASAGQLEPIVFSVTSLRNLGAVAINVSDLITADGSRVPAAAIRLGVVSHRLTRVTSEGSVYTIAPRFIMPKAAADLRKGDTTTFWLTLHTPAKVKAGVYRGRITLALSGGGTQSIALEARLFATPLDPLDVPAGPWGSTIDLPWPGAETAAYNEEMFRKCLAKMREYGLTAFSGIPTLRITGWKDRKPDIDFSRADREMAAARAAGFTMVVNYNGGLQGFDNYHVDEAATRAAGFTRYPDFLRAALTAVADHAKAANWLPMAWNLCDEPLRDAVAGATENARAWREALPPGVQTTGATSVENPKPDDPHLALAKALTIPDLNMHDEVSIKAIHDSGANWAFYNGGSRWTFGTYMYKAAKQYGMKFRLSWHWNACAGDPYYALDCREDDYAWCVADADGNLIPVIHFDRDIRAGVDDYRYLLTLDRLIKAHPDHSAAPAARKLIADKLASFRLGERDHDAKWPSAEFHTFRFKLAEAIEQMSR